MRLAPVPARFPPRPPDAATADLAPARRERPQFHVSLKRRGVAGDRRNPTDCLGKLGSRGCSSFPAYDSLADPTFPTRTRQWIQQTMQRRRSRAERRAHADFVKALPASSTWAMSQNERSIRPGSRLSSREGPRQDTSLRDEGGQSRPPADRVMRMDHTPTDSSHSFGGEVHASRPNSRGDQGGGRGGRAPQYTSSGLSASGLRAPGLSLPAQMAAEVAVQGWLSEVPLVPQGRGEVGDKPNALLGRYFYLSRTGLLSWSNAFLPAQRPAASDEPPPPVHGARIDRFSSQFELYVCSTRPDLELELQLVPPAGEDGESVLGAAGPVLQLRADRAVERTRWLEVLFMVTSAQRLIERGFLPAGMAF